MAFDIKTIPILSTFRAVGTVDNTTAQPTVIITWDENQPGPYKQVDNTVGNDVLLTELPVIWSADVLGGSEQMYLTSGAVVANKTRQVQYTVNTRGPLNQDSANPITTGYSRNYKSHKNNAFITIDETWLVKAQNNTFTAGTTTNSAEAGETLALNDAVSIHTDGKVYLYHKANYPSLVGTSNAAYATGVTATYTTFGGVSTGHSGLTIGSDYYAENTGTITSASSSTATKLGVAETATTIRVVKVGDVTTLSDANIADETNTTSGTMEPNQLYFDAILRPCFDFSTDFMPYDSDAYEIRYPVNETGAVVKSSTGGVRLDVNTASANRFATIECTGPSIKINNVIYASLSLNAFTCTDDGQQCFAGFQDGTTDFGNADDMKTTNIGQVGFLVKRESGVVKLYAISADSSIETTDCIDMTTGEDYMLNIIYTESSIKFYVDGTLEATHTTEVPTNTTKGNKIFYIAAGNLSSATVCDFRVGNYKFKQFLT